MSIWESPKLFWVSRKTTTLNLTERLWQSQIMLQRLRNFEECWTSECQDPLGASLWFSAIFNISQLAICTLGVLWVARTRVKLISLGKTRDFIAYLVALELQSWELDFLLIVVVASTASEHTVSFRTPGKCRHWRKKEYLSVTSRW